MSNYFRPVTTPIASKQYVCIACGWLIPKGEKHDHQTGFYEGVGFSNRYHFECWLALDHGNQEFSTGDVPVPERFKDEVEAHCAEKRKAS